MSAPTVTALFFGYGTAGVIGTLIGGRLVARSRAGTFTGAALTIGVIAIALPELSAVHLAVGIIVVAWGLTWGLIPLAAQVWMQGRIRFFAPAGRRPGPPGMGAAA
ncbi:MAG: hypothetical protein ACLPKI_30940 [Streptosporangiaceae bacterium]